MKPRPLKPGAVVLYLRRENVKGWPWPHTWTVAAYDVPPDAGKPGARPLLVNPEPPAPSIQARHRWHAQDADKPTKGCRVVLVGTFNWRAVWLPDLKG